MLNLRLVGDNAFNDIDTSLRILLDGMQHTTVSRRMDARSIECGLLFMAIACDRLWIKFPFCFLHLSQGKTIESKINSIFRSESHPRATEIRYTRVFELLNSSNFLESSSFPKYSKDLKLIKLSYSLISANSQTLRTFPSFQTLVPFTISKNFQILESSSSRIFRHPDCQLSKFSRISVVRTAEVYMSFIT